MMAGAKRIYILIIKVNRTFSFSPQCFLKEIENMFSMFLLSYTATLVKVWDTCTCDSKQLWKHSPAARVPTAFLTMPLFSQIFYLTNRFHVAVRLFSNRSQVTSKCGKNKKVAHKAQPSVSLMSLPNFDVFCDLLLNRCMATWNLLVLYNNETNYCPTLKAFVQLKNTST